METHDKDGFEQLLDHALKNYGKVEPRTGLEGRVLAGLDSQKEHTLSVRKWILVLSSPALAFLFIAVTWQWQRQDIRPVDHTQIAMISHGSQLAEQAVRPAPHAVPSQTGRARQAKVAQNHTLAYVARREPKLEHFPSPRPLSPQEAILAQYVAKYPQEAALAAKEQQNFDQEIRKAEQEVGSGTATSNE